MKENGPFAYVGALLSLLMMVGFICAVLVLGAALLASPQTDETPPAAPPPAGDPETGAPASDQPPTPAIAAGDGLIEAPVEPANLKVRLPALSLDLAAYGSPPADFNVGGDLPSVPDGMVLHIVGLVARVDEEGRITMRLLKIQAGPGLFFFVPFMRDGKPVVLGTTMASFDAMILAGMAGN